MLLLQRAEGRRELVGREEVVEALRRARADEGGEALEGVAEEASPLGGGGGRGGGGCYAGQLNVNNSFIRCLSDKCLSSFWKGFL